MKEKGSKVYIGSQKMVRKLFKKNIYKHNQVLSNKNVIVCIHLPPISFLLFILLGLFAFFIMQSFSNKQKSQYELPGLYTEHFLMIFHFISV